MGLDGLVERSEGKCELCGAADSAEVYEVPPVSDGGVDSSVLLCGPCKGRLRMQIRLMLIIGVV